MNFNWDDALEQILGRHLVCPRCQGDHELLVVGYASRPSLTRFAARHGDCQRGDDCDARKLITLCEACARAEHFRGASQDASQVLTSYMLDCRRELDDALAYLSEYWRDDPDLDDDELDGRPEDVDPEAFAEESAFRLKLEEEYLRYHRQFREQQIRIPEPGWRSDYVDEICTLGYTTLLGD